MLSLVSCGQKKKVVDPEHSPLSRQRLVFRSVGLSNRTCVDDKCSLKVYDINNADTRKLLNDAGFVCQIGGKRYRICKSYAGFCRRTEQCAKKFLWVFHCQRYVTKYISITHHDYLKSVGVICKSYRRGD